MDKKNTSLFSQKISVADIKLYNHIGENPDENLCYKGPEISHDDLCKKIGKIFRKIIMIIPEDEWNVKTISPYLVSLSGLITGDRVSLPVIIPTIENTTSEIHIVLMQKGEYAIHVDKIKPSIREEYKRNLGMEAMEDAIEQMDFSKIINTNIFDINTVRPQGDIINMSNMNNMMVNNEASTALDLDTIRTASMMIDSPIMTATQQRIQQHEELIKIEVLKRRVNVMPTYILTPKLEITGGYN